MTTELGTRSIEPSNKARRLPRSGTGFTILRLLGLFCRIIGLLLLGISAIICVSMVVRGFPSLLEALRYSDQKMAGFGFLITLGALLLPLGLGVFSAILVALGYLFKHLGTMPGPTG